MRIYTIDGATHWHSNIFLTESAFEQNLDELYKDGWSYEPMTSLPQRLSELTFWDKMYNSDNGVYIVDEIDDEVEEYLDQNGLEWQYADEIAIDEQDNMVYCMSHYGEQNYVRIGYEVIGRARIESEDFDHEEFLRNFINNHEMALPSWYKSKWLVRNFEKQSCEFQESYHGDSTDPESVMANTIGDALFQIESVDQFQIQYCIWVRETNTEEIE